MAASWECEEIAATCVIKHFDENKEVEGIIDRVTKICKDENSLEFDLERLTAILDQYQEQPHLLDTYLEKLISCCLEIVKENRTPPEAFHQTFRYLYLILKTRGAKYALRYFTHEVADMEPVLTLLSQQNIHNFVTWQTRYCLLLWLSIICMIPFDLAKFDGSSNESGTGIINSILRIAKNYIFVADKSRDAAAYLLAKFLSRPDVRKLHLSKFFDWSVGVLMKADHSESMEGLNSVYGCLSVLCNIFKYGSREDMLVYAVNVLRKIEEKDLAKKNDILLKKLSAKVVQRLGLCLLKPRLAPWRYQRGSRSLVHNLQNPFNNSEHIIGQGQVEEKNENDEEDIYHVPEEVEQVLQHMLLALKDRDTVVRWSAAKGIGRICARLPKDLADDVIGNVLEFFNPIETDGAWHGGCLALAELGKRGLLLPERLPEVVPMVLKALVFDERRGSYNSGTHVRDAACYACWSFARAYDPKELTAHITNIASALVIVSLFDREPNCRRAASAAFQEHVGRQGTFPHGIDVLATVDYFTVGNIANCFINLSIFVAKFSEYTKPIIDHLVEFKVCHWDRNVRELTSKSLANLTAVSPDYIKCNVLPKVLLLATSADLNARHGGLLATAEVSEALCHLYAGKSDLFSGDILQRMESIVSSLKKNNYFDGLEGDFMRTAVCKLIEKFSTARVPLHWSNVRGDWQGVIDDCLPHTEASIQEVGVAAFHEFCHCLYASKNNDAELVKLGNSLIDSFVQKLESSLHFDRMGYALGLGALPASMIERRKEQIIDGLLNSLVIEDKTSGIYAEPRRNAVKALTRICETLGLTTDEGKNKGINKTELYRIFESLFTMMRDYSIDSRGDVGAWVREAAMSGLEKLCQLIVDKDISLCPPSLGYRFICCLVQQSAEKIDRTRALAGDTLLRMVHLKPALPDIPNHQELRELFPQSDNRNINWAAPSIAFSNITKLLPLPAYRYCVLLGITVSVGGLTESLVRHSSESLLQYLWTIQQSTKETADFNSEILTILEENSKNDRIVTPLLRMLDLLISNGCFDIQAMEPTFPGKLATLLKGEVAGSGDAKKLISSIKVFCGIIQFPGDARTSALSQLMVFLCHKYPRVRKETAEALYTTLITFEDVATEEALEEVLAILSDTPWDTDVEQLRGRRNVICNLLSVPVPKLKRKANAGRDAKAKDELESYQDLVTRHGY